MIRMELDEIVAQIVSESEIDETEIREKIKAKQDELGGLITLEGAAHVVANSLGINLFKDVSQVKELEIENIIPGMKSVDVVGRVMRVFPTRMFTRKDGGEGKLASLILGDGTGTIRAVFWGGDANPLEEGTISEDTILRIRDGYTKENLNNEAELHIGTRTRVIPNPPDVDADGFPTLDSREKKINELEDGQVAVDVLCKVLRIYDIREFEREGQASGRVVNLTVADETGRARVALWDEDVGLVENEQVKEGDLIHIRKGYVKVRYEEPEINVGKYGKIVLNPEGEIGDVPEVEADSGYQKPMRKDMADVADGDRVEIRGALVDIYENINVFEKKDGTKGMVINAIMDDGTGNLRAVFFDKMAEALTSLSLERVEEGNYEEELRERKMDLIGKEVIITASVRHSDFSGKEELAIWDINLNPDPRAEVKTLLGRSKVTMEEN